jgi:hypothetical protein
VKCHPDGQLIADIENARIALEYSKLDLAHGQVDFPRNKFWDLLFGQRSFSGQAGDGKFYPNNSVTSKGYVTNYPSYATGTPPPITFGGSISSISEASSLIKSESNYLQLFRNFGKEEMQSLLSNDMKFIHGQSIGKDFWTTEKGLEGWKQTGWGGQFTIELQVDREFLKFVPKSDFVNDPLPNGTHQFVNIKDLGNLNKYIKSFEIKK